MKTIIGFFKKVAGWFTSGKAKAALDRAATLAAEAGPFIDIGMRILTTLTPPAWDEQGWALVTAKYPQAFDPNLTVETRKLFVLGVVSELFAQQFKISTSEARAAISAVFLAQKA